MIFGKRGRGPAGSSDDDLLIEAAAGAYRARDAWANALASPDWADLTPGGRERLFDLQMESRAIEALLDPQGIDTTGHVILERIRRIDQEV